MNNWNVRSPMLIPNRPIRKGLARARHNNDIPPLPEPSQPIPTTPGDHLALGWLFNEEDQQWQLARISSQDREGHMYIIGRTRFGKTKQIEFLIQQDIQQRNGFCFIDPHGDSIEAVKGLLAVAAKRDGGEELLDRVVVVDPTNPTHSVSFNLLELLPNVPATKQAQELVAATRKIWIDSWGPRMEQLYRASLVSLGEAGQTFGDLPQFLASKEYRALVLDRVSDPIARLYFERFNSLSNRDQLTWSEPVTNKVFAFLSDERIRQMLSYLKSFFREELCILPVYVEEDLYPRISQDDARQIRWNLGQRLVGHDEKQIIFCRLREHVSE